ncbi:MAG: 23S rRNA pseudouridine(2604) synthase RluF [Bacteroidota bacterium]
MEDQGSISLNKYISQTGICSRREADKWIEAGRVKLNGEVARKGNRVAPGDVVLLDGQEINKGVKTVYLLLNKPAGITCTTDLRDKSNIIDFLNYKERIFPVGRLDKASTGLILLTNDGDIVNKILREENYHEKEYEVRVNRPINTAFIRRMSNGIPILGTVTKKCKVERLKKFVFRITLTQGLNRQIRRMCEHLGYDVLALKRTRIMHLKLGQLKIGAYRHLNSGELRSLLKKVASSKK